LVLGLLSVMAVGCPGGKAGDGGASPQLTPETKESTGGITPAGKPLLVGVVLDTGGVDDRSFNAAANAGLEMAKKTPGVDGKYVESNNPSDYTTNLTSFASQNYNLVFAVGFKMAGALKDVSPSFPNVKFAIIDAPAPDQPNCAGLQFREQEGSFLAGYLAASVTKSKKIGFVGGEQIPLIEKFEAGYKAGAKMADPTVVVTATYTGDWNDESKGRSQADQQFGSGADIIYHAAGKAGLGVIEAAKARGAGFYAIGVDQDQDAIAPGRVLTSMVKHIDTAMADTVARVKSGQFEKGTHVYGLKENGVGLSEMKYTRQDVPAAVLAKLDKVKQMIIDGKLVPPTSLKELETFKPPAL
jgi:basic membrane protein A